MLLMVGVITIETVSFGGAKLLGGVVTWPIIEMGEGDDVGDEDNGDGAGEGFGDNEGEGDFFFFLSEESFFVVFLDSFLEDFEETLVREPFFVLTAAAAINKSGDELEFAVATPKAGAGVTVVEGWWIDVSGGSDWRPTFFGGCFISGQYFERKLHNCIFIWCVLMCYMEFKRFHTCSASYLSAGVSPIKQLTASSLCVLKNSRKLCFISFVIDVFLIIWLQSHSSSIITYHLSSLIYHLRCYSICHNFIYHLSSLSSTNLMLSFFRWHQQRAERDGHHQQHQMKGLPLDPFCRSVRRFCWTTRGVRERAFDTDNWAIQSKKKLTVVWREPSDEDCWGDCSLRHCEAS